MRRNCFLIVIAGLAMLLAWRAASAAEEPPPLEPLSAAPAAADIAPQVTITITDQGFQPAVVTITVGSTVGWRNATAQARVVETFERYLVYLPLVRRAPASQARAPALAEIGFWPQPLAVSAAFRATLAPGALFTYTFGVDELVKVRLVSTRLAAGKVVVIAANLPPDPSAVAPPADRSVPADIYTATAFLYTGSNPIQTGVAPGTIDPKRVAVARGRVLAKSGAALTGVRIAVLGHPEYGQTRSRADGQFDLVVNGGGPLVLDYQRAGYLPLQREQQVPWRDYTRLPDVVMQPTDLLVSTVVSGSAAMQVIRGSTMSDGEGSRSANLLVPPGTRATLILTGGVTRTLAVFHARITEYTVGAGGPSAMPAELPPQSGYTYAVEYSVDEAVAAGALNVAFSQPLLHYSHNFLGFPVGMAVPTGYYDRVAGRWVASTDGRVVKILAVSNGLAQLDTDGDGVIDNGAVVTPSMALTITVAERQSVAQLYQVGQSLWRVPISHFSPWDCNWPYGPPPNAKPPKQKPPGDDPEDDNCDKPGSIVECQNQTLGETAPLAGTPFHLRYQSDRAPGRKTSYTLDIPLTGVQTPPGATRIDLVVQVAGREFKWSKSPAPNLTQRFVWDGLDAYGRAVQGSQPAVVQIGYVYSATYQQPAQFEQSFAALSGVPITGERARQEITLWQVWRISLGAWDARGEGLGGWSLSAHHVYDANSRMLLLGDGGQRSVSDAASSIITTRAGADYSNVNYGDGGPAPLASTDDASGLLVTADGTLYIADTDHGRVRRVTPDGAISTVAGGGSPDDGVGDGLPATQAKLDSPRGLALGPDGSLYISEFSANRVRRVLPGGVITTYAGGGLPDDYLGDGLPARQAMLNGPSGLAIAPNGALYIADRYHSRVRTVGASGIITTFAGDGWGCDLSSTTCGEGGPATLAQISWPAGLAFKADGRLYVSDAGTSRVLVVAANGILTRVAGTGEEDFSGDGGPALQAKLNYPEGLALGKDGSLYIADSRNGRTRRVTPSQIITTFAGSGAPCENALCGEGGPAAQAKLTTPLDVAAAADGRVYIADAPWNFGSGLVRVVLPDGAFSTAAGYASDCARGDGLPATLAGLCQLRTIVLAPDGGLFVGEAGNRLRRIRPDGVILNFAGVGRNCPSGDQTCGDGGPASQAYIAPLSGLALGPDGSLYLSEESRGRVRRIGPDGIIRTVAGCGNTPTAGCVDAEGGLAVQTFIEPFALAIGPDGSLYLYEPVPNGGGARIRRVGADGRIATVAGGGQPADWLGDGLPATQARLNQVTNAAALAVGRDGSLYVADFCRVRRIGPDGIISTFAGNGTCGSDGDGGPAEEANLFTVAGLAIGPDGSLYMTDNSWGSYRVRRVGPDGLIATVAGGDRMGWSGDGGPATAAALHEPVGLAVGPDGALYIADTFNERIRVVTPVAQGFSTSDMLVTADDGSEVYVLRDGRHLRTLDALTGGLRYEFAYDAAGRLASVTDGDGNLTRIERDAQGKPTAIVAPGGQRAGLAVNAAGYLTAITDPAGAAMTMEYGTGGLLARLVDARGGVHRYSYDADGRLIRDEKPDGGATSLARVEAANAYTVTATDALNRATRYVVERLADGGARRVRVDPAGARSEVILATDGGVEMVYPDGTRMSLRYAPDPRWGMQAPLLASAVVTTPGGLVSTRGVSRTVVLSDTRDILSLAALTDTLVLNGRAYTTTYDSRTRALAGVTPEGARSVSVLDARGRVTQTTEAPGLLPSLTVYDARGRLSQVSQGGVGWTIGYDAGNRQVSRADMVGNVTRFGHDAAGRVVSTTLPGGGGRVYLSAYDGAGNRTQVRMPSGALHQLGYAPDGQWAGYTPPGGLPYAATLNLAGQSARVTLPSGRAVNKTYDAGGRLAGVSYPEAAYVFEYADATDQPTLLRRSPADGAPAQSLTMRYDGDLAIEQIFAGPASGRFAYRYDADHALISTTLDGAAPVLLAYDRDGRLAANGSFTLARGGPGGRTSRIQGAGLDAGLGYDTIGRLVTRTVAVAGQAVYAAQVERDGLGRIARKAESVAGSARVYTYTHDANNQLLQVWRDGTRAESYAYDANGNRVSRQAAGSPAEAAVYDAQDRLTQRGGLAYVFDADGYLTGRGGDTFTYSARGELLRAVIGGQAVTYGYDAWGRRVSRTDGAGARQYLYGRPDNLLQLTASRDSGGALTQYFYDDTGRLFALQRGGAWYFVATDAAGTPRAVANAAGAVVKTLDYDAFGNLLADSNPAFELAIGFAGGLADPATGLTRFGWRDYDPAAGRWAARDPLLFEGESANLYAYVGNNPVNLSDPTGLLSIGLSGGEGIGGGVKGSITSEGTSFCVEAGFVVGGGLEVDPAGDLDPPTVYAQAELSGKLGPVSGGISAKADECMNDEVKAKACSGPMCAEADLLTGKMGSTVSPPEKGWTKMRGAKIEGKAVVGKCWRFKW